ncbi:hypothetical protein [Mycoplasmopsis bovis]|uniref:hypothetical protein n=2 Tax=Mycoplasmopsis bovis TaxID=28903 RepID=UPI003C2F121D
MDKIMDSSKTNFDKFKSNFIKTISSKRYEMLVKLYYEINYLTFGWAKCNNIQAVNIPAIESG